MTGMDLDLQVNKHLDRVNKKDNDLSGKCVHNGFSSVKDYLASTRLTFGSVFVCELRILLNPQERNSGRMVVCGKNIILLNICVRL